MSKLATCFGWGQTRYRPAPHCLKWFLAVNQINRYLKDNSDYFLRAEMSFPTLDSKNTSVCADGTNKITSVFLGAEDFWQEQIKYFQTLQMIHKIRKHVRVGAESCFKLPHRGILVKFSEEDRLPKTEAIKEKQNQTEPT